MAKSGIANFPRQDVSDSKKSSKEYGLQVAKAIEAEWWSRDVGTTNYTENREEFHRRRLYARAEQDIRYYKDWFAQNGDLSYVNLDWNPVPIIPKFVDLMVNGMQDRLFHVKSKALDPIATEQRTKYVEDVREDIAAKAVVDQYQQELGVDVRNVRDDNAPKSTEELDLYMEVGYKQGIEIAVEQAVDNIFQLNKYQDVKRRIDNDLVTLGIASAKHSFNNSEGICLEYVDPANLVYSRGEEDPNFNTMYYAGEVKQVRVNELVKQFPNMSDAQIKKIVDKGSNYEEYDFDRHSNYEGDDENTVTLLYFNWKTYIHDVHKVKKTGYGTDKAIEKDDTFQKPENAEGAYEKVDQKLECLYEGVYVIGSKELIKWEKAKNMVRPNSNLNKVVMNYVVISPKWYKGRIESHVDRMIPYADLIQLTHLKMQQVIQRMRLDGIYIDADGITEVDLGNGTHQTAMDALNMYVQTGNVIGRSMTTDGDPNPGARPVQDIPGSDLNQLTQLVGQYQFYVQMIRDITGINEARDASDPDQYSLVGVQKLAAANSNVATRHIQDASMDITKFLAEATVLRFQDVLEYHPTREQFIGAIGKFSVGSLKELNKLHLHDFGIFLELEPDEEEKQLREANIQAALAKDQILLSDAIDIRNVKNVKLANELLKLRQNRKIEEDHAKQQELVEQQAEANSKAAQAAEEAKAQAEQIKAQAKLQVIQGQEALAIKKLEVEAQQKKELMQFEFELNMQLKQLEIQGNMQQEKLRGDMSAAQQEQSSLASPPSDPKPKKAFESKKNDTLEGGNITTNQFDPR